MIERLLQGVFPGWRLVTVKGNHDAMMIDALRDPAKMLSWIKEGGDAALASYGGDPAAVPQAHIAWFDALQLMHVDAHRVYVHAGVDPQIPLNRQSEATLLTKRYSNGFARASVPSTWFTATTALPTDRCCMQAVATWIPRPGRLDG